LGRCIGSLKYHEVISILGEKVEESLTIKDIIEHRNRDYDKILSAMKVQDRLRKKLGGKESVEIIREWRDSR
jgi:hypothetical protein